MFVPLTFDPKRHVLKVLDQTRLPLQEHWRSYEMLEEVARSIETMEVRGAPAIACAAAFGLVVGQARLLESATDGSVKTWGDMQKAWSAMLERMSKTRPTAVNLFQVLEQARQLVAAWPSNLEATSALQRLTDFAVTYADEDLKYCQQMGQHAVKALAEAVPNSRSGGSRLKVLTHCNAGSLATAGYGTALGVIRSLHAAGRIEQVWVDETRPYLQGARLTAFELKQEGIPYKLIVDSAAAFMIARGEVDVVVTGADRIARNGDTANKIGTLMLAVACKHYGVPFYIAAPHTTFDDQLLTGADIPIEMRAEEEVTSAGAAGNRVQLAADGTPAYNPSFDVTPGTLISGYFTEKGTLPPFAPNTEG